MDTDQSSSADPIANDAQEDQTDQFAGSTPQHGSASSGTSSGGGSHRSIASPTLDPAQHSAMTSSVISTLDLGEEPAFTASRSPSSAQGTTASAQGNEKAPSSGATATGDFPTYAAAAAAAPLAPRDVLSPVYASTTSLGSSYGSLSVPRSDSVAQLSQHTDEARAPSDGDMSGPGYGTGPGAAGDDSALNALMDAHSSSSSAGGGEHHPHRPSKRDASFGLDPDVDTSHTVEGQPFRPHLLPSPLRQPSTSKIQHHHHHHQPGNPYDQPEESAPSHTSAETGAPHTTETGMAHTQTVPSVSATGMPRFLPRRTSRSPSLSRVDDKADGRGEESSCAASEASAPRETQPRYAPSGSLTLALFSPGIGWRRRSYLLLASLAINVGLPFVNGVMLGFGEIFARSIVAPWIGLAPAAININAPAGRDRSAPLPQGARAPSNARGTASSGGVGLRYAGASRSG